MSARACRRVNMAQAAYSTVAKPWLVRATSRRAATPAGRRCRSGRRSDAMSPAPPASARTPARKLDEIRAPQYRTRRIANPRYTPCSLAEFVEQGVRRRTIEGSVAFRGVVVDDDGQNLAVSVCCCVTGSSGRRALAGRAKVSCRKTRRPPAVASRTSYARTSGQIGREIAALDADVNSLPGGVEHRGDHVEHEIRLQLSLSGVFLLPRILGVIAPVRPRSA